MNPFDLTGQVACITGANTGIGQAICIGMAKAGADIIGVGRSDMTDTAKAVSDAGRSFLEIKVDLAAEGAIDQILSKSLAWKDKLDVLVNNAGIIRRVDSVDMSELDWDDVIDINLKTTFFLSQAFARVMLPQANGGRIINIASLLSFQGGIRVASYTASKHGVAGLTKVLANEWAAKGVNVNAIAPGYITTNNTAALVADPERNASILARIPAGRWGEPDDIAGAAVFLASHAARYIHGTILPVDGGWLAR